MNTNRASSNEKKNGLRLVSPNILLIMSSSGLISDKVHLLC